MAFELRSDGERFVHRIIASFVWYPNIGVVAEQVFYVSEAAVVHEALDRVRINYYNILILEDCEVRSILGIVRKWNGLRRREVNIVLVEAKCQSMHPNEAFMRGVNSVVSATDGGRIENFLELALGEYESYIEPWTEAGRKIRQKG